MFRKFNIYDVFIVLILATLASGSYFGGFSPTRIVAILLAPIMLLKVSHLIDNNYPLSKYCVFFCIAFFAYALLTFLWTPDVNRGAKDLIYWIIHFIMFLELIAFSKVAKIPLSSICLGWAIAVLITIPIALREFIFNIHLDMARFDGESLTNFGAGVIMLRRSASVTFFNINTYSIFLFISLIFVFCGIFISRNMVLLIFFSVIAFFAIPAIIMNASRGAILSAGILVSIFSFYYLKGNIRYKLLLCMMLFGSTILFIALYHETLFASIEARLDSTSFSSDQGRFYLYVTGLKDFFNSAMMGTGVGADAYTIAYHNFLLEVLVKYGIVGASLLCMLLFLIFYYGRRVVTSHFVIYSTLISFPIWSIVNSTYMFMESVWALIACLCVFAEYVPKDNFSQFVPRYHMPTSIPPHLRYR